MLKFSVITVCYNSVSTIEATLKSVGSLRYPDIEHIIIDGKSTDGTLGLIKKCAGNSIVISEPDKGMYDAMNKGISLATGDFIGILNADDIYVSPRIFDELASRLDQTRDIDFFYTDILYTSRDDISKITRYWNAGNLHKLKLYTGWHPPHTGLFISKRVIAQLGKYDLRYKIASDYDYMVRLLTKFKKGLYIPIVTVAMRSGGISNRSMATILQANKECIISAYRNIGILAAIGAFLKISRKIPQLFAFRKLSRLIPGNSLN
ncbi:MAG: glycosyltransferase [Oligoflexales bacterium]|nr:glycosyltransferase [Oligoflexales bacterium]